MDTVQLNSVPDRFYRQGHQISSDDFYYFVGSGSRSCWVFYLRTLLLSGTLLNFEMCLDRSMNRELAKHHRNTAKIQVYYSAPLHPRNVESLAWCLEPLITMTATCTLIVG